jgi:hypothetical protein
LYALWLKPFVALLGDPARLLRECGRALRGRVGGDLRLSAPPDASCRARAAASLSFLISAWNVPLDSKVTGFAL